MFIDPITVQYPEALEKDRFVIATYYCATKATTNSLKFAVALAIEQTCGTWLKVPGETQEVRERSIGRVVGVYETPSYQIGIPSDIDKRHFIIRIAFPATNFGPSFAMMLSSVIGNISSSNADTKITAPIIYPRSFTGLKNGVRIVSFMMSAENLLNTCYVLRKDNWSESIWLYQRLIEKGKIKNQCH